MRRTYRPSNHGPIAAARAHAREPVGAFSRGSSATDELAVQLNSSPRVTQLTRTQTLLNGPGGVGHKRKRGHVDKPRKRQKRPKADDLEPVQLSTLEKAELEAYCAALARTSTTHTSARRAAMPTPSRSASSSKRASPALASSSSPPTSTTSGPRRRSSPCSTPTTPSGATTALTWSGASRASHQAPRRSVCAGVTAANTSNRSRGKLQRRRGCTKGGKGPTARPSTPHIQNVAGTTPTESRVTTPSRGCSTHWKMARRSSRSPPLGSVAPIVVGLSRTRVCWTLCRPTCGAVASHADRVIV